ncbi:MAG TPA: MFS transporter [Solirubrobacteraceae bacterium]|nr:MFS transporter [Solirubrobacteraceae bacterium]
MTAAPNSDRPPGARGLGRDFWVYFAGQTLSQLGGSFTLFALPLLVYRLTHSATNLALTTVAEFGPYLLFGLILGALVDRADRRRLMLRTDVARGLVIAVLPAVYLAGALHVWTVYAVGFVQATLGIIFDAGQFAAIPSLVGREDLVAANGRIMATGYAGQVLGPLLAGVAVLALPVAELFLVDAASFGVSALTLGLIRRSFNAPGETSPSAEGGRMRSLLRDARHGLRFVISHPVLRTISVMMALINFVGATEWAQLVLFAKRVLGASDTGVSGLYAAGAAGVVVLSLLAARIRRRLSFRLTALGALVLSGLTTAAMAIVGRYWAAIPLWAAASGLGMLFNINTGALRQAIVPPELFARVATVAAVLAWSAIPLGALAGAAIMRATGEIAAVYVGAGLLTALIACGFSLSPIRHGDRVLGEGSSERAPGGR